MTSLTLHPHEARAGTRLTHIVRRLQPQPTMLNGGKPMNNGRGSYAIGNGWQAFPLSPGAYWGRETWKPGAWREDGRVAIDYAASPEQTNTPWINLPASLDWDDIWLGWTAEIQRNGSLPDEYDVHHWEPGGSPMRWRSPVTMPQWASRYTITVTAPGRVCRVSDITEAEARGWLGVDLAADERLVAKDVHAARKGHAATDWVQIAPVNVEGR